MLSIYSRVFLRVRVLSAALSSPISSFKISASALTAQRCSSSSAAAEARMLARVKLPECARSVRCICGNGIGDVDFGTASASTDRSERTRDRQPGAAAIDEFLLPVPSSSGGGSSRGGKPAEVTPGCSLPAFMSAVCISLGLCCGIKGAERGARGLDDPRVADRLGDVLETLRSRDLRGIPLCARPVISGGDRGGEGARNGREGDKCGDAPCRGGASMALPTVLAPLPPPPLGPVRQSLTRPA